MGYRAILIGAIVAGSMALAVAGCGTDMNDASDNGGVTPGPTANAGRMIVPAPIDELELIIRESAPPQYAVRVVSGLPDGCTEFYEATLASRTGTTIDIEVTNTIPSGTDVICTAIYGTH